MTDPFFENMRRQQAAEAALEAGDHIHDDLRLMMTHEAMSLAHRYGRVAFHPMVGGGFSCRIWHDASRTTSWESNSHRRSNQHMALLEAITGMRGLRQALAQIQDDRPAVIGDSHALGGTLLDSECQDGGPPTSIWNGVSIDADLMAMDGAQIVELAQCYGLSELLSSPKGYVAQLRAYADPLAFMRSTTELHETDEEALRQAVQGFREARLVMDFVADPGWMGDAVLAPPDTVPPKTPEVLGSEGLR
ncbi:MAG: hypothetical protein OXR62_10805 [Ahrensia sp.]|nr:hypothetical protein [Ahrensia sp.]